MSHINMPNQLTAKSAQERPENYEDLLDRAISNLERAKDNLAGFVDNIEGAPSCEPGCATGRSGGLVACLDRTHTRVQSLSEEINELVYKASQLLKL